MATPSAYAHFKMNETTGTTVDDTGSGNNDATCSDDLGNHDIAGKINGALLFDTSQNIAADALAAGIASDTVGSFAFWLYPSSDGYGTKWTAFTDTTANNFIEFYRAGTESAITIALRSAITAQWTWTAQPILLHSNWTHLLVVQDGTEIKVYRNGYLVTTGSFTVETDKTKWLADCSIDKGRIVSYYYQPGPAEGESFLGAVDDWRYYKEVLTAQDALNLWRGGVGTEDDPPSDWSPGNNSQAIIIT